MSVWLWIAFRFCIFVLWTQSNLALIVGLNVVNCFQILYIRSLNTMKFLRIWKVMKLWIAFRFCIFVLWTQYLLRILITLHVVNCFQILYIRSLNTIHNHSVLLSGRCELLSDFVYSFFEHNLIVNNSRERAVVNCFQILYIRSLNTITRINERMFAQLWIAFRFCIFVLWTQWLASKTNLTASCELLSDFVYSFFEHNLRHGRMLLQDGCELLSDFVYSFFEHNAHPRWWR